MAGYFAGKKMTEEAIANALLDDSKVCIVKPSFIFGGDAFSVNPPRVTSAVRRRPREDPRQRLRQVGRERSSRPIALTLAEPVAVDDVAGAVCSGGVRT